MSNAEDTNSTATTASMEDNNNPNADSSSSHLMQESSERLDAAFSEKCSMSKQGSDFSLTWLKMSGSNSSGWMQKTQPDIPAPLPAQNLRVQVYQPPKLLQVIVEETKVGIVPPVIQLVKIEEPKMEVLCEVEHKAILEPIEEIGVATESTAASTEPVLLLMSDEEGDQSNKDTYESFEDTNDTLNCPSLLPAVDSRCCASCPQRSRERETQTSKAKTGKRDRVRLLVDGEARDAEVAKPVSHGSIAANSSDCVSSDPARKLAIKSQNQSTFKQRQLDLHRHKILVEQRRLELLELKIARERDEMLRDTILYEKELEIKAKQLRKLIDDRLDESRI